MKSLSVAEPTVGKNPKTFASALMKIWLRLDLSHSIVIDKDSKFCNVFAETAKLLQMNMHVFSRENHDGILVKCVIFFLNSSLTIFCNKRGTTKVSEEGILMSLYAWNSAPLRDLIFLAV